MSRRTPGTYAVGYTSPQQFPFAWVNFNGLTGGPIRDSRNVTSVTRTTTGTYTVTLTRALAATEYLAFGAGAGTSATGSNNLSLVPNVQNTTRVFSFESRLGNGNLTDWDVLTVGVVGRF